jgi:hypothetical protein
MKSKSALVFMCLFFFQNALVFVDINGEKVVIKMEKEEGKEEEKRIDAPLFIFSLICALLFFSVILGSFVKFPTAGSRVVYDRTHKLHSAHDVHFSSHHHHHE